MTHYQDDLAAELHSRDRARGLAMDVGDLYSARNTSGDLYGVFRRGEPVAVESRLTREAASKKVDELNQREAARTRGAKDIEPNSSIPAGGKYNKEAVNKAISSSRQKIGGKEAVAIHRLLKGRTGDCETAMDAKQKPYISKVGNKWELLDEDGKTVATSKSLEELQPKLRQLFEQRKKATDCEAMDANEAYQAGLSDGTIGRQKTMPYWYYDTNPGPRRDAIKTDYEQGYTIGLQKFQLKQQQSAGK